jgi:hypothetical protein
MNTSKWIDSEGKEHVQAPGEVWSNTDPRLSSGGNIIHVSISKKIRMSTLIDQLRPNVSKRSFNFKIKGIRGNILMFENREKAMEANKWIHETNHHQYGIEAHLFDDRKLRIVITGDYTI